MVHNNNEPHFGCHTNGSPSSRGYEMNGVVAPLLRISCRQRNPIKDRDFPNVVINSRATTVQKTPCKRKMAVWRRPGLLRQSNPGVPSDVMVCLRVLARTGRVDCRRPCASFPPSSGSTAMSILCVARWRSARGMIEWMCTQERLEPGSRHHIWRGGTLPPGYSWQQS